VCALALQSRGILIMHSTQMTGCGIFLPPTACPSRFPPCHPDSSHPRCSRGRIIDRQVCPLSCRRDAPRRRGRRRWHLEAGRAGGDISSIKYCRRIASREQPRVRGVCVAFSNAVTAVASHFSSRLFVRLFFWELVPERSRAIRLIYRDRYWHAGEHNCTREEQRGGRTLFPD